MEDWCGRKTILSVYQARIATDMKQNLIREYYRFPRGWTDYDTGHAHGESQQTEDERQYQEFLARLAATEDDTAYLALIEAVYQEILRQLDIGDD